MHVLIPAAGSGSRMKAGKNKLLIELEGESLIYWTLKSIFSSSLVSWVGIIGQPNDKNKLLNSVKGFSSKVQWINGGETRQESVYNGLKSLPSNAEKVLIHDGARSSSQSRVPVRHPGCLFMSVLYAGAETLPV